MPPGWKTDQMGRTTSSADSHSLITIGRQANPSSLQSYGEDESMTCILHLTD